MLNIANQEHYDKVKAFAESIGAMDELQKQLDYLGGYACHDSPTDTKCNLFSDFARGSFAFTMEKHVADGSYKYWFNGGLIYRGPGQPHDGSAPALTVDLSPAKSLHSWGVHT